jgi:hypothetical protein
VLHRLAGEVELFHVDTQGGFRQGRSTEDMITLVKLWQEMAGEQGRELLIYFSDFKSAFTSVSHKAINKALAEAGASDKTRALIRVIYDMAELQVKVQGRDGDSATSEAFSVDRGSPQGDGLSPMVWLVVLNAVLRKRDPALQGSWRENRKPGEFQPPGTPDLYVRRGCGICAHEYAAGADAEPGSKTLIVVYVQNRSMKLTEHRALVLHHASEQCFRVLTISTN